MKQDWLTTWKAPSKARSGEKKELRFTSVPDEEGARLALSQELDTRRELLVNTFHLQPVGEPYEGQPKQPELVVKVLYGWFYNTQRPSPTNRTAVRVIFFYALDEQDARRIADEKRGNLVGPLWEEALIAFPAGLTAFHADYTKPSED